MANVVLRKRGSVWKWGESEARQAKFENGIKSISQLDVKDEQGKHIHKYIDRQDRLDHIWLGKKDRQEQKKQAYLSGLEEQIEDYLSMEGRYLDERIGPQTSEILELVRMKWNQPDFSYKWVGDQLGLSEATVKRRLRQVKGDENVRQYCRPILTLLYHLGHGKDRTKSKEQAENEWKELTQGEDLSGPEPPDPPVYATWTDK